MSDRVWNKSLLVTAALVAAVSAASIWLAWQAAPNLGARLTLVAVVPVLAAAVFSYLLRILRFHYFLTRSGVEIPLRGTAVVQMVGFALSVTPAHLGEVFKLHLIRERAGAPVVQTAPLLLLDRLTEGGGFMILALASALALPALRAWMPAPIMTLAGLTLLVAFGLVARQQQRLPLVSGGLARCRLTRRLEASMGRHLRDLWNGLRASFAPGQIAGGLALSAVARFSDGLVVLFAARLLGLQLALPAAVFVLAASGLAGGISLLPAGTGAVETTMTGLLALSGASWQDALAITLLARLSTLWLWVALGLALAFVIHLRGKQTDWATTEAVDELNRGVGVK